MPNETLGRIILPTMSALVIWNAEIRGQLSDGMWENAAPLSHWRFWCGLDSLCSEGIARVEVRWMPPRQKTGYNLAALYPIVGDRMLKLGRIGRAVERMGINHVSSAVIRELADALADDAVQLFNASEGGLDPDLINACNAVEYTMRDLRKDVAGIKLAMRTIRVVPGVIPH
jgi:hypothetical protein